MDHLPVPTSSPATHPDVPYLCKFEYDGGEFQSYPSRQGFDKGCLQRGERDLYHDDEETAAFLQSWLFFGLLWRVLGVPINVKDYLRTTHDGQSIVTTAILPLRVSEWKGRVRRLSPPDRHSLFWETDAVFCDFRSVDLNAYDFYPEVIFSIQVLAASLSLARLHIWDADDSFALHVLQTHTGLVSRASKFAVEKLKGAGWCTKEVMRRGALGSAGLYFASLLPQQTSRFSHASCTIDNCVEDFIDLETYETIHVDDGCACRFIGPDPDKVRSIIESGEIPLVRLSNTQPLDIDVVPAGTNHLYTAISHVWKDGLGNTKQNLLPLCQLSKLRDLVKAVKLDDIVFNYDMSTAETIMLETGKRVGTTLATVLNPFVAPFLGPRENSVYLWIDTICVPLQRPYRSMALNQIRGAFERAKAVLVLDAELQTLSSKNSFTEICIQIYCSRWMRRLWTLEEAIVAPTERLYLQLSDAVMSLDSPEMDPSSMIPAARYPNQSVWPGSVIHYSALMEMSAMRQKYRENSKDNKIIDLFSLVQRRYTTKNSDVPIVIASTLGLNVSKLSDKPSHDRMEALFSLLEYWPSCLIFSMGPHLRYPYGWAPQNLLAGMTVIRPGTGLRTKWGLMVSFPGFALWSQEPVLLSQPFKFLCSEDDSYYGVIPCLWGGSDADEQPVDRFAIILAEDEDSAAVVRNSDIAVIVTIASEDDDHAGEPISCQYKCLAAISRDENTLDKLYTGKIGPERWLLRVNDNATLQPPIANVGKDIIGWKQSPTQEWCVG